MRPSIVLLATTGVVGACVAFAAAQDRPRHKPPDPARVFRKSCAGCHTVPDPAVATDRAWLDQVHRTR